MLGRALDCEVKNLLKISAFLQQYDIISPLTNNGGTEGNFYYLKSNLIFPLCFRRCFRIVKIFTHFLNVIFLASKTISVDSLDLVTTFAKSMSFLPYLEYCFIKLLCPFDLLFTLSNIYGEHLWLNSTFLLGTKLWKMFNKYSFRV